VPSYDEDSTLFVYGSLVGEARRVELLGRRVATASATLQGYALGRARYFYIRAQVGAATTGLLLLELRECDFAILDTYEELPILYTREKIEVVDSEDQLQRCWVYMPTPRTIEGS
jgi:gamma-glutamylcyclotransferase (GGCT)/AIG2-like uncharacterized protein YtfP